MVAACRSGDLRSVGHRPDKGYMSEQLLALWPSGILFSMQIPGGDASQQAVQIVGGSYGLNDGSTILGTNFNGLVQATNVLLSSPRQV